MATLALLQLNLAANTDQNLDKAEPLAAQAAQRGATLLLLPELFPFRWFPIVEDSRFREWAEPASGPIVERVRSWARLNQLSIALPTYERTEQGLFNTTYIISGQGAILGKYRKTHLPYHPGWYEKYYYEPGDSDWPIFFHQGLIFGVQTCWDNLFPEGSRILGTKGVHLILAPRGTGDYSRERWRTVLAANALSNNCFVATANRTGFEGSYRFGADSCVISPSGVVTATSTESDELLLVPLNLDEVYQSRREWPFFQDRRPHMYRSLSEG